MLELSSTCQMPLHSLFLASYFNYNKDYGKTSLPVIAGPQCPRGSIDIAQRAASCQTPQDGYHSHRHQLGVIYDRGNIEIVLYQIII